MAQRYPTPGVTAGARQGRAVEARDLQRRAVPFACPQCRATSRTPQVPTLPPCALFTSTLHLSWPLLQALSVGISQAL